MVVLRQINGGLVAPSESLNGLVRGVNGSSEPGNRNQEKDGSLKHCKGRLDVLDLGPSWRPLGVKTVELDVLEEL